MVYNETPLRKETPMFNFETLHKNHKMAFLDGFLCGVGTAYIAYTLYKDYREMKDLDRRVEEERNNRANPAK
jgi:hypothetical protein